MTHLVLIETSGNQRYIFSTNRLRENAGASEIVFLAGTKMVVEAISAVLDKANKVNPYKELSQETAERVESLLTIGETHNCLKVCGVEIIISTSGKALLLVDEEATGKAIISHITRAALTKYPGLNVLGIVGSNEISVDEETSDGATSTPLANAHLAVKKIHAEIEELKLQLPSPLARFPTLPFSLPCHSSSLPAQKITELPGSTNEKTAGFSNVILEKNNEGEQGFKRIAKDIDNDTLSRSPFTLDCMEELEWSAIVHADGNGFGKLFMEFDQAKHLKGQTSARSYFNLLRQFSCSLELCGLHAFKTAIETANIKTYRAAKRSFLPIVPLILGGDDLTVVMDGRQALKFTEHYLRAFEDATIEKKFGKTENAIPLVTGNKRLGAGAGIAIVKPHYPFHRAYELAESLISSAKRSKSILGTPAISVLDFHVLFDNGATNFEELRTMQMAGHGDDKVSLTLRPYIVSNQAALNHQNLSDHQWVIPRRFEQLRNAARQLTKLTSSNDENAMPSNQLHMLRDAIYRGKDVANARYDLIKQRYQNLPFENGQLFCGNGEPQQDDAFEATHLLDVMELIDLEQSYKSNNQESEQEAS